MRRQEWIRKLLHIPGGLAPPLAVFLFGWTGAAAIAVFLLAYLLVAWDLGRRGHYLPIAWALVVATSRDHEPEAVAAAEFLTSALVLGLLFPLPYFFGAMALLGVGDGVASIVGQTRGVRRLPWNPRKTWAGLAAGLVAGTIAYVLFAIIGGQMQAAGYADGLRLVEGNLAWTLPLMLVGVYVLIHAGARLATASGLVARRANAHPRLLVMAFCVSLAPTVAFLLVAPAFLEGPFLPTQGGHGDVTRALLVLAPIVAMLVESAVRRNDNLWVPGVACAVAYGAVRATGAA